MFWLGPPIPPIRFIFRGIPPPEFIIGGCWGPLGGPVPLGSWSADPFVRFPLEFDDSQPDSRSSGKSSLRAASISASPPILAFLVGGPSPIASDVAIFWL